MKANPTSGIPEVRLTLVASELASSEVQLEQSEAENNSNDNVNNSNDNVNDQRELINDELSISRPFNIITQAQNNPNKSAKSKANVREQIVIAKIVDSAGQAHK